MIRRGVVVVWTCTTLATFFFWHRSAEIKAVARMPGWFSGNSSGARRRASSRKDIADSAALRERVERVERHQKTALRVREGESTNGTDAMARLTRLESINGTGLMAGLTRLEEELTVLRAQVLAGSSRGARKPAESLGRHARVQTHAHTELRKRSSTGLALRYNRSLDEGADNPQLVRFPHLGKAPKFRGLSCEYDPADVQYFEQGRPANLTSYIVLGAARSGTSWVQEVSISHPWIITQFELDFAARDYALNCMQCKRQRVPNSKDMGSLPPRVHPPGACGQTIFGRPHKYEWIKEAGDVYDARLIIILRLNFVATTISSWRHFSNKDVVPYEPEEFLKKVTMSRDEFEYLMRFPAKTLRPSFIVFYEDMIKHPNETFYEMQKFLRLPVIRRDDLGELHRKSSNKPSIYYLKNLEAIQASLVATEFEQMIQDPAWEAHAPVEASFKRICSLNSGTIARWRGGTCGNWTGLL